jgi:GntR family transcriptional repressor for pyruvate dehydrogenase complex
MSDSAESGWQPVRRLRTHEHVLDQIQQQIASGRLGPGDRLPGERELAEYLDVSRAGVREALRVLEALGVISAGVGSGPGAGSVVTGSGGPALARLLSLHVALSRFSQREVMEVRVQLERWAVSEAAARATDEDVARLRSIIMRMRQADIGYEEFNELDTSFHVAVAAMCGNALLADLMSALREVLKREMLAVFENLADWTRTAAGLAEEHQGIVDAIEEGDSEAAAARVEHHIATFYALSDTPT